MSSCPAWCRSPHDTPGGISHAHTTGPGRRVWTAAVVDDGRQSVSLYHMPSSDVPVRILDLNPHAAHKLAGMLDELAAENISPADMANSIRAALGLLTTTGVTSDTRPA